MEYQSLRTRLAELMQKSRRALRLYAGVGKGEGPAAEFAEAQANEWKVVNADLLRQLSIIVGLPNSRRLVGEVAGLRDRLVNDFRSAETELHQRQTDLINAAEAGDFIKAAIASRELVVLKARFQAAQAAHHEIQSILDKSHVSLSTIELPRDQVVDDVANSRAQQSESSSPIAPRKLRVPHKLATGTDGQAGGHRGRGMSSDGEGYTSGSGGAPARAKVIPLTAAVRRLRG